jgi:hypothetical protein
MPRLRFNIAGALGAILFVAVAFAALRQADDLWKSSLFSLTIGLPLRMIVSPGRLTEGSELAEPFVTSSGSPVVVLSVGSRYNKLEQYAYIILRANSEGELLRFKDIAKVWLSSSFYDGDAGAGATENFVGIGHSLFAFAHRLARGRAISPAGSVSEMPEVLMEGK